MSMSVTIEQRRRNESRRRIYLPGDLVTAVRGDESVTRFVSGPDDEGDIFLPGAGPLTNIYGTVMDDDGWHITRCERRAKRTREKAGSADAE